MRGTIYLWKTPALIDSNRSAALNFVEHMLAFDMPDCITSIRTTSVAMPQPFYVEVSGISDPAERARWRFRIETAVGAAIRAALSHTERATERRTASTPFLDLLTRAA